MSNRTVQNIEDQLLKHKLITYGVLILAAVVLTIVFVVEGNRDAHRAGQLMELHNHITHDSLASLATRKVTDSVLVENAKLVQGTRTIIHTWDSVYVGDTVHDTIPQLLASATPDSVKVIQLVGTVKQLQGEVADLKLVGNQLRDSTSKLVKSDVDLRAALGRERQDASDNDAQLHRALAISERMARHWGLGATCGLTTDLRFGCAAGVTYRY